MIVSLKRFLHFIETPASVPEVQLKVSSSLSATLMPYQMVQINPEHLLMFESGIKLEPKSASLWEAYNTSSSSSALIAFHPLGGLISLAVEQPWKLLKKRTIFATSQLELKENEEFFEARGSGKVLASGHQLVQLDDESFFLPQLNLAGHELRVDLKLGSICGKTYWKVTGPGHVLVFGSGLMKVSKDLEDLQTSSQESEGILDGILKNDDMILTDSFKSFIQTLKKRGQFSFNL